MHCGIHLEVRSEKVFEERNGASLLLVGKHCAMSHVGPSEGRTRKTGVSWHQTWNTYLRVPGTGGPPHHLLLPLGSEGLGPRV